MTKQVACAPMPLDAFTESADHGGYVDKSSGAGGCKIEITAPSRYLVVFRYRYIGSFIYRIYHAQGTRYPR